MATEKLKYKLELYSEFWDKAPIAEVLVNDKSYWSGEITSSKDEPTVIEFTHESEENKEVNLVIKRSNKDKHQTKIEDSKFVKDQLLFIKSINIDEIEIGNMVYEGVYRPEYLPEWAEQQRKAGVDLPETQKNVTCMGHNGVWTFTFSSPFYMWLLENLY